MINRVFVSFIMFSSGRGPACRFVCPRTDPQKKNSGHHIQSLATPLTCGCTKGVWKVSTWAGLTGSRKESSVWWANCIFHDPKWLQQETTMHMSHKRTDRYTGMSRGTWVWDVFRPQSPRLNTHAHTHTHIHTHIHVCVCVYRYRVATRLAAEAVGSIFQTAETTRGSRCDL